MDSAHEQSFIINSKSFEPKVWLKLNASSLQVIFYSVAVKPFLSKMPPSKRSKSISFFCARSAPGRKNGETVAVYQTISYLNAYNVEYSPKDFDIFCKLDEKKTYSMEHSSLMNQREYVGKQHLELNSFEDKH